MAPKILVA